MNDTEKREKIEMAILARLQRDRTKAAAVTVLRPLIERAKVPKKLKESALVGAHATVAKAELHKLGPERMVDEIVSKLVEMGSVKPSSTPGEYEFALELPDLSPREAASFANKLLADWPSDERAKVLAVFRSDDEAEEDDEDES